MFPCSKLPISSFLLLRCAYPLVIDDLRPVQQIDFLLEVCRVFFSRVVELSASFFLEWSTSLPGLFLSQLGEILSDALLGIRFLGAKDHLVERVLIEVELFELLDNLCSVDFALLLRLFALRDTSPRLRGIAAVSGRVDRVLCTLCSMFPPRRSTGEGRSGLLVLPALQILPGAVSGCFALYSVRRLVVLNDTYGLVVLIRLGDALAVCPPLWLEAGDSRSGVRPFLWLLLLSLD